MIKEKNTKMKYILTSIACISLFIGNVRAKILTTNVVDHGNTDIQLSINGNSSTQGYKDYEFQLKDADGTTYNAYCVDPGYHLNSGMQLDCQPVDKPAMMWLTQNLTGDRVIDNLAVRMLAVLTNMNKATSNYGQAIVRYTQARMDYVQGTNGFNLGDYNKYMWGSNKIDTAYNLAWKAYKEHSNDSLSTTPYLNFSVESSNENHVKLTVTSNVSISPSDINFTCEHCDITNKTWGGTSGTIELNVNEPECSYVVNAFYNTNGTYICFGGTGFQNLIANVKVAEFSYDLGKNVSTTGNASQKYVGTIGKDTGGNYYAKYCDSNVVCSEKTKIEIPSYCDDANGEAITITAPNKNIVQCIINNKDEAGNTYQMIDGQVTTNSTDNPYCTVWCKEDYQMYLPGAKYGDSGRYFALENTEVHAQRTCYTSGPDKSKTNIDIDLFIKDAIAAQKDIVDKYNNYVIAKTKDELINSATLTSNGKKCDGSEPKNWHSVAATGKDVTTYKITSCNNNTGVCTVTTEITNVKTHSYGTSYSHAPDAQGVCQDSSSTTASEDTQTASKKGGLNTAITNFNDKITHFQNCYSWHNNLCMADESMNNVLFKYDEDYDINYKQISKNIEEEKVSYKAGQGINKGYDNTVAIGTDTLKNYTYIKCDADNLSCSASIQATNISTLVEKVYYLKKEKEGTATYNNIQRFKTNYPHGTIEKVPTGSTGPFEDYEYLGTVFPIMYKTPTGVYNWTLTFNKIGQYNDTNVSSCNENTLGRLNQVAQTLGKAINTDLEYVCIYVVDCPECEYECECPDTLPDGYTCQKTDKFVCKIITPDPKCPECEIYCINCIFDGDSATYMYRTISLNSINPNDRDLGSNWTTKKGLETKNEIEKTGEDAYKEPEYSYTITPTQMKAIRDYNKDKETYVVEELDFNSIDGKSSWLRDNKMKNKYFTQNKINDNWQSWTGTTNENGTGPSWK